MATGTEYGPFRKRNLIKVRDNTRQTEESKLWRKKTDIKEQEGRSTHR
jgi:hypothetical protein